MMKLWRWLWNPHPRYALGVIGLLGVILGVVFVAGANVAMDMTISEAFCISCHEMHDTPYKEYIEKPHYKNASGVRATCADCHVPKELGPKILSKFAASTELYHSLIGTIDTPEKYEERRLTMAKRVWDRMTKSDSRECRTCHTAEAMDFTKMKQTEGLARMEKGLKDGETCISCHKGIAHNLPDMAGGYRAMIKEISEGAAQAKPKKGDTLYSFKTGSIFLDVANATPEANGDGKMLAASQGKVVETKGDWLKVKFEGWQQEGAERVLYALKGQRILNLTLAPELMEKVAREKYVEDPDTGLNWAKASLEAWVARADMAPDQEKLWAYADELYRATCGTCHNLTPIDHSLANQWPGTLNAMKRFISIDDEEYRFLQKYLQFNAKDTKGKGNG